MIVYVRNSYKPRRKSKKPKGEIAKKRPRQDFIEKKPTNTDQYRAPSHSHIPSHSGVESRYVNTEPKYEGEMASREAIAQEEIARKAKCVAPLYSKGAYQYVATEEQAKWIGRK